MEHKLSPAAVKAADAIEAFWQGADTPDAEGLEGSATGHNPSNEALKSLDRVEDFFHSRPLS